MLGTGLNLVARGSPVAPSPLQGLPPVVESCDFFPDPRVSVSFVCGDDNSAQPAYVGARVQFRVNVSGDTNLNVTFYFDYLNATGAPIPSSPNVTIQVAWPGTGLNTTVYTNWTYTTLNANWTFGDSSMYWVSVLVKDDTGLNGSWALPSWPVWVNRNSEPVLSGLNLVNSVSESITYQKKLIPLLYVNVSASDPDSDPLTVTWDWGDGTRSVDLTGPTTVPVDLNVTHQYSADRFPLNETPRYVHFPITVWVDDGVGHNVSLPSAAEFFIDQDNLPIVRWDKPLVGSVWKVGDAVPMVSNVSDPEGDPLIVYWDFDNRTDSNGDGNPTTDRDANGTTASHAYSSPGQYNITLWATDGESKKLCFDWVNCTSNPTGYVSHWSKQTIPIQVQLNRPPVLALDNGSAIKGEPTMLRVHVLDQDGDSMTVTWRFGDGTPDATNITASGPPAASGLSVYQNHTYAEVGRYNLTIVVSDGNSTTTDTKGVFVESFNLPPGKPTLEVLRENLTATANNTFRINETVVLRITLFDPENDTLDITVEWGDGNITTGLLDFATAQGCTFILVANDTRYACPVSFSHAYLDIGSNESLEYDVVVTVTDHQDYFQRDPLGGPPIVKNHAPTQTVVLIVKNPRFTGLGPWDLWDFSTLAAVVGLPVALIGRWAYKVRKERKEE